MDQVDKLVYDAAQIISDSDPVTLADVRKVVELVIAFERKRCINLICVECEEEMPIMPDGDHMRTTKVGNVSYWKCNAKKLREV